MFDGLSLRQDVGPVVWPPKPEKVAVRMGEIPQADVDALVAEEMAKYAVDRTSPKLFERSVRLALALESVTKEHGFDAFTAFDQVLGPPTRAWGSSLPTGPAGLRDRDRAP